MNPKLSFHPGDIPQKPGVYIFRDRFGEVIYVGKATNLRKRLSHYFQRSRSTLSDPKLRSLINSIDSWEVIPVKNESESLILESRLIKEYAPKYNVLLRDDKRFFLIKINLGEPYPKIRLTRIRRNDEFRYFGPFPKGDVKGTADFLTRHFGLRACQPDIPDEKDFKHCLASKIKNCSAPCVGKVTREGYMERVAALMKVLAGDCETVVCEIRRKMEKASLEKRYEVAARWRDLLSNIEGIFGEKKRSFRFAAIPSSFGADSVQDLQKALGIEKEPKVIEAFDISNISGQFAVASMVCFRDGRPERKSYRRFKIRDVHQIDDFAMMNEVVKRHYSRKLAEKRGNTDLIMVDGGKGQLNAALDALISIKYPPTPILGLAKRNEEIFLPGRTSPLILDRNSPALKLLQAVRDEAHRFAISYHRELRGKRIEESVLDEIEGIGDNRKIQILREFGSIENLKKASAEQIAERIPGIGLKLAEMIKEKIG
jgi:excinuclease ABC subunit C